MVAISTLLRARKSDTEWLVPRFAQLLRPQQNGLDNGCTGGRGLMGG
jgi:hypothetical protein